MARPVQPQPASSAYRLISRASRALRMFFLEEPSNGLGHCLICHCPARSEGWGYRVVSHMHGKCKACESAHRKNKQNY